MILPIVTIGEDILGQKSEPVKKGESIKTLITDMFDTLYSEHGIGLAAVQVRVLKRIFVVDIPEISNPQVFINPKIKRYSHDFMEYEEGCLSIPGVKGKVKRPRSIEVVYYDENFVKKSQTFSELFAICIQHEIDHLNGILFLERLEKPEIRGAKKQLKKMDLPREFFSSINLGGKALPEISVN